MYKIDFMEKWGKVAYFGAKTTWYLKQSSEKASPS